MRCGEVFLDRDGSHASHSSSARAVNRSGARMSGHLVSSSLSRRPSSDATACLARNSSWTGYAAASRPLALATLGAAGGTVPRYRVAGLLARPAAAPTVRLVGNRLGYAARSRRHGELPRIDLLPVAHLVADEEAAPRASIHTGVLRAGRRYAL